MATPGSRTHSLIRARLRPALITTSLGLAMALAGPAASATAGSGITERVSVSSTGAQSDQISGDLGPASVSGDGRYVAFDSFADNLVPGDTNGK